VKVPLAKGVAPIYSYLNNSCSYVISEHFAMLSIREIASMGNSAQAALTAIPRRRLRAGQRNTDAIPRTDRQDSGECQ
jgi:hypothetical protein